MKPITSEKAVRMIELDNTLIFEVEKRKKKEDIKKEFEELFKVKAEKIRVNIKRNKKFVYIKVEKKTPAIDVATKLGMI